MKESIVVEFSLYSDVSSLIDTYNTRLEHCRFMIDKIQGKNSDGYNADLMCYANEKNHLEWAIKKLEELQSS